MQFLILEQQVAGAAEQYPDSAVPNGGKIVDGPDLPIGQVYWDGRKVKKLPKAPSANHFWDVLSREWKEVAPLADSLSELPDWQGLADALRGSEVWAAWFEAAASNLRANAAATLLLASLLNTKNAGDLHFALEQLDKAMTEDDAVVALTKKQQAWLGDRLAEFRLEAPR